MRLTPPTKLIFTVTLIIAAVALLSAFGVLSFLPISAFWLMTIAYGLLVLAVIFKGL